MIYINRLFFNLINNIRKIYLRSNFYDSKISKVNRNNLEYKPSPHLLSSLIKYQKQKFRIEDFSLDEIWGNKNINSKDFDRLNNFYWFFSLDLKSSKKSTQSVIQNWISYNFKYNVKSWSFDLTAKRIIAWLSCHNLTYEENNKNYTNNFNAMIKKQANHLISEINKSNLIDDKLIGCASIILVGLCYQNEKKYLSYGSSLLKKISKETLDNSGFPKSRSIKKLIFYLKYLENVPKEESLWEGECFVFDQRVSVTHGLEEGIYEQCYACRHPLNPDEMKSFMYVKGESCPYCHDKLSPEKKASLHERQKQIELAKTRGEKHIGREFDNSVTKKELYEDN